MTQHKIRFRTILLASALTLAVPLGAQAAPHGGGGHGGGGGGGHGGGGGGGHGGGGGGGHGGGVMHFGGGGRSSHIGVMHASRGLANTAGVGSHIGNAAALHSTAATGVLHEHRTAGREGLAGRENRIAGREGFLGRDRFGGRGGGHFASRGDWHRFRGSYGWAGPLFWPYAYDDLYDDVFWGYGYDPFWNYGYGDIFGGLFSPYGFDDLAGYLPGGGGRSTGRSAGGSTGTATSTTSSVASQLGQMCGDDTKEVAGWPIDRIQQVITPDDQQRAALDGLANGSVRAAQIIKSACPTTVSFTPTGRIAAMQTRLEAMAQAIDVVRGPLDKFYASLTDEQKARLNAVSLTPEQQATRARGSVVQNCNAVNAATQWPTAQIEKAVRPIQAQQAKLDALKNAVVQAADQLGASCLSDLPATPPARLAADAKRIDVMLDAVKNVRAALDDFYASLNDEQKAQFNLIGQAPTAQR